MRRFLPLSAAMVAGGLLGASGDSAAGDKTSRPAGSTEMVGVPAGPFFMGCNAKVDFTCYAHEKPGRQVSLPAFRIDKTEVTVAAYGRCVEAGACKTTSFTTEAKEQYCNWGSNGREDHPMNCVDWAGAQAYCRWAGKRLPTEQEWEKAARGTDGRRYPWGNEDLDGTKRANIGDKTATAAHPIPSWDRTSYEDGFAETAPVGRFPAGASPFGALDMSGNVYEWTADWYTPDEYRTLKGGSWSTSKIDIRASSRHRDKPSLQSPDVGFRCVQ